MQGSNGSQGPSHAPSGQPDFGAELRNAQQTGDFEFVLNTAKGSHKMLVDFRHAVRNAKFPGDVSQAVAMGLNFLDNMIVQASGQINALKQAAKATNEAMKSGHKEPDMHIEGPETPEEPTPEAPPEVLPSA